MEEAFFRLTVYFDSQFYVGLFERAEGKKLTAFRHVFGAEPSDPEVYDFVLKYAASIPFCGGVAYKKPNERKNPKARQREIKAVLRAGEIGTFAQRAISQTREQTKMDRKSEQKSIREHYREARYEQRKSKKKQKHRGR